MQVCRDSKGTHSVQCLIEVLKVEEEEPEFSEAFEEFISTCFEELAFDKNGTHVIVKFLLSRKDLPMDTIFQEISRHFLDLCYD
jgi:hypothetical protein